MERRARVSLDFHVEVSTESSFTHRRKDSVVRDRFFKNPSGLEVMKSTQPFDRQATQLLVIHKKKPPEGGFAFQAKQLCVKHLPR